MVVASVRTHEKARGRLPRTPSPATGWRRWRLRCGASKQRRACMHAGWLEMVRWRALALIQWCKPLVTASSCSLGPRACASSSSLRASARSLFLTSPERSSLAFVIKMKALAQ